MLDRGYRLQLHKAELVLDLQQRVPLLRHLQTEVAHQVRAFVGCAPLVWYEGRCAS